MPRMTKLTAVNQMLREASEQPVSTLVSDGTNDVSLAVDILDVTVSECQLDNPLLDTTLSPTSDNKILLSDSILSLRTRDTDCDKEVERRGRFLFNLTDNTDVFTEPLKVSVRHEQPFEDLPLSLQLEVAAMATRRYQRAAVGDPQTDRYLAEELSRCQARARSDHERNTRRSWLDDEGSKGITQRRYRDV